MAKPRKLKVTRYRTPDGQECRKGTPGAIKTTETTADYYGAVPQPGGRPKMARLCSDFAKSRSMLEQLRGDAQIRRYGLNDPFADHASRRVTDHIADYAAYLRRKGTANHAERTQRFIFSVLDAVEAVWLADLDAEDAADELAGRREDGAPIHVKEKDEGYRLAEVCELLTITRDAVAKAIRTHRLPATGSGRARRYPASTVQALADRRARGSSPETVNHYTRALRSFGRWLVKVKRVRANPFEPLELLARVANCHIYIVGFYLADAGNGRPKVTLEVVGCDAEEDVDKFVVTHLGQ